MTDNNNFNTNENNNLNHNYPGGATPENNGENPTQYGGYGDNTAYDNFDKTQRMSQEHLNNYHTYGNNYGYGEQQSPQYSFNGQENYSQQTWAGDNNAYGGQTQYTQPLNYDSQYNNYGGAQQNTAKKSGSGIWGVALASAVLGGLIASGVGVLHDNGVNNSETITKQSITQNVTGDVNWKATATTTSPSVVTILVKGATGSGEGSGVIYSKDGYIITNNHVSSVAGNNGELQVSIGNKVYNARVVGSDEASDLAVLKISSKSDLTPIKFADSSKVTVGEQVMAVGSPLGLTDTATTGIISALNRPVITKNENSENYVITNALQTSAPINPGNSGGALVNKNGELVGINSSIATLSSGGATSGQSGSIGIGFAIPSNSVKNIVEQILKNGEAKHAMLGITPDATIIGDANSGILGIKISSLTNDSPAGKAGLSKGDVITNFNGHNTTTEEELIASVRELNPGDKATIKYYKNGVGDEKTVTVTLAAANK